MLPEVGITFRGKGVLEPMQAADGESMYPEPVVRRRGGGSGLVEREWNSAGRDCFRSYLSGTWDKYLFSNNPEVRQKVGRVGTTPGGFDVALREKTRSLWKEVWDAAAG